MPDLETNFSKTCLYSSSLRELPEMAAADTLNCVVGLLPVNYLGILLSGRRPPRQDWEGIILRAGEKKVFLLESATSLLRWSPYSCEFYPICNSNILYVHF